MAEDYNFDINISLDYARQNYCNNPINRKQIFNNHLRRTVKGSIIKVILLVLYLLSYFLTDWDKLDNSFPCQNFQYTIIALIGLNMIVFGFNFMFLGLLTHFYYTGTWHFHKQYYKICRKIFRSLSYIVFFGFLYFLISLFFVPKQCRENVLFPFVLFIIVAIPTSLILSAAILLILLYFLILCCGLVCRCISWDRFVYEIQDIFRKAEDLTHNHKRKEVEDIGVVDEKECVICYDNHPNSRILPCGHNVFCDDCLEMVDKCPMCRGKLENIEILKNGLKPTFSCPLDSPDIENGQAKEICTYNGVPEIPPSKNADSEETIPEESTPPPVPKAKLPISEPDKK